MRERRTGDKRSGDAVAWIRARSLALAVLPLLLFASAAAWAGQDEPARPTEPLPEAPQPQNQTKNQTRPPEQNGAHTAYPCKTAPAAAPKATTPATTPISSGSQTAATPQPDNPAALPPCPTPPPRKWFARFYAGPGMQPLSTREKGWLAVHNVLDPFTAVTILGTSAVAVGSDSHSAYGPGMAGFGRNVGVSYTQEMTGEFIGTFLIPSIVHQEPRYRRMPKSSVMRRLGHAIAQVVWTQGDNGKAMPNYATLLGFPISDQISNLYVPGRETDSGANAARYAIGVASAPIDNFITEFLPDVAIHIHIHIVLLQRVIDQVAKAESPNAP